jgi:DNA polymerase III epsilon subunit-like protein
MCPLNGNLLASIDLETTGLQAGYHEPIQIAVAPLNSDIRPLEGVRQARIKPAGWRRPRNVLLLEMT